MIFQKVGNEVMKEVKGNIWEYPSDYKCITINGALRKNGTGVMGAGIALEAKLRYPDVEKTLGEHIKENNGKVRLCMLGHGLIGFPTKYHFMERNSNLNLIKKSARELNQLKKLLPKKTTIALTRPGCRNGHLKWKVVKPILEKILSSDNFIIVDTDGE